MEDWKSIKRIISQKRRAVKGLKKYYLKKLKHIRNPSGKSPLHVAAKKSRVGVTEFLLELGCNVNLRENKKGFSPLTSALVSRVNKHRSKEIVKLLVKSGADVNIETQAIFQDPEIVTTLCSELKLREGGPKEAADHLVAKGWTLDDCARLGDEEIICGFSSVFNDLLNAVTQQDVLQVRILAEQISHSKRIISWVLNQAVKIQSPKSALIVKTLLDYGAPVNGFPGDKRTPLEVAFTHLNVDVTWTLLEHEARLDVVKLVTWLLSGALNSQDSHDCLRLILEYHRNLGRAFPNHSLALDDNTSQIKYLILEFINRNAFSDFKLFRFVTCFVFRTSTPALGKAHAERSCKIFNECGNLIFDEFSSKKIVNSTIDELVSLTNDQSFMDKVNSENFVERNPTHGKTLKFKVKKAAEKRIMFEKSIFLLSGCLPSPASQCYPVLNRIVYFLGFPNFLCDEYN